MPYKTNRRRILQGIGAAGVGSALAGCTGDEGVPEESDGMESQEQADNYYGVEGPFPDGIYGTAWDGWDVPSVGGEFERTTGIEVDIPYMGSNVDGFSSLEGGADYQFIVPDNIWVSRLGEADLVQPIDEDAFSDILDEIPDWIKNNQTMFHDGVRYGIPPRWGVAGIIYNSENVSQQEVQNYSVLWDEEYEDRVTVFDVPTFSVQMLTLYLEEQGELNLGLADMDREEMTDAVYGAVEDHYNELEQAASDLFDNCRLLAGTTAEMNRPLLEGEVDVAGGFMLTYAQMKEIEQGLGQDRLEFEPTPGLGGLFWVEGMAITQNAETEAELNGVQAFMRWTLSEEGQARLAWTDDRKSAPTNTAAHQHLNEFQRDLLHVDEGREIFENSLDYMPTRVDQWTELWEDAK